MAHSDLGLESIHPSPITSASLSLTHSPVNVMLMLSYAKRGKPPSLVKTILTMLITALPASENTIVAYVNVTLGSDVLDSTERAKSRVSSCTEACL